MALSLMSPLQWAILGLITVSAPALAQNAAPPRPEAAKPNPELEAAQHAFDALPEAERKAIQDDLIWGSTFNATVSGSFGPRTFDAIRAFERTLKAKPNGILEPEERSALAREAKKSRDAIKFAIVTDKPTGAALGLPLALLTKREPLPIGTLWTSRDEALMVRTGFTPGGADDLPRFFEAALAMDVAGRKVTYKLLRPDFFVVSGEVGPRSFYTRTALGQDKLVSYTITFPTARAKQFERVMIALANSFQPVAGATPTAPPTPAPAMPMAAGTLSPGLMLTGLVTAPGRVLTGELARACPELTVNGKPARLAGGINPVGVTLLEADTGKAPAFVPAVGSGGENAVLVGYSLSGGKAALAASGASILPGPPPRLEAPLHAEGGGSLAFDRRGNLIGLVHSPKSAPRLIAGIVPAVSHAMTGAGEVLRVAGVTAAPAQTAPQSVGEIVSRIAPSLVAVECGKPVPLPK